MNNSLGETLFVFQPAPSELFFSKSDPEDPRLGELCRPIQESELPSTKETFLLAGYPDDEGVGLNGGRRGAEAGPNSIRKPLYKMTPDLFREAGRPLADLGNLNLEIPLKERHSHLAQQVQESLKLGCRWIGLGGGHDYGYPDGAGFLAAQDSSASKKPLVINFDAHLDVRPLNKGLSSGTPFYRLLSNFQDFDFLEIGIQSQCNSRSHYKWALDQGAHILTLEEMLSSGDSPLETMSRFVAPFLERKRPAFVSVDIDGFSSSYAMGASQSWPTGILPQDFFPLFDTLNARLDLQVLGIYEVCPKLDLDSRTSKLAAQIVHRYLYSEGELVK